MDNSAYHSLLEQFLQAPDEMELQAIIEKNLTKLDMDFDDWLENQASLSGEDDSQLAQKFITIRRLIQRMVCLGNYQNAVFDESAPVNAKELLLGLERKVELGESSLETAAEQGAHRLAASSWKDSSMDLVEMIENIHYSQDKSAFVTRAELLYRITQRNPDPLISEMHQVILRVLSDKAMKLRAIHEFEQALQYYDRVIAISRENRNSLGLCIGLMSKGDVCQVNLSSRDYPEHLSQAEGYYLQALEVCTQAELALDWQADILLELGKTFNGQRHYKKAIERLEECLSLYRSGYSHQEQNVYSCLFELSEAALNAGDFSAASIYIKESIKNTSSPEERAARLARLTTVLGYLADDEGAEKAIAEAVQIVEELSIQKPIHDLRSTVYGVLGTYQTRSADFQGAIDAFKIAIEAAEAGSCEGDEARWRSNLGQIYMYLNQWEQAESLFKTAGWVHAKLDDNLGVANLAMNVGYLRTHQGELDEAAEIFSLAFTLFYQVQHPGDMLFPVIALCRIYKEKGNLQRAEACIHYCLAEAESLGSPRIRFYALGELAALKAARMQFAEAIDCYQKAVALAQQAGEIMAEQEFRISYGKLLEQNASSPDMVEIEYRRAVELQEIARGRFRIVERRIQFQNRSEESYARLVLLLSKRQHRKNSLADAFNFSERARSRTLIELLSRRPIRYPLSMDIKLAQQEKELLVQLSRLEISDEVGTEPAKRYMQLSKELEEIWHEMAEQDIACRDYVDLRRTPLISLEEIKELLAD
jgi:tetratricopeptide (TPR) repeat protein